MSPILRSASGTRPRATAISASEASSPETRAPRPAASARKTPDPQPTSRTARPEASPTRAITASNFGASAASSSAQAAARAPQMRPCRSASPVMARHVRSLR